MPVGSFTADNPAHIRLEDSENLSERTLIHAINDAAFGGPDEGALVDQLRADGHVLLSLVFQIDARTVGHILFSRMWIDTATGLVPAVALAPVAVLPECQRQGIGSRLILHGLGLLRDRGEKMVIVVGHPDYYPRFGFSREKTRLLSSPFPPEAFMASELTSGALDGVQGAVVYPPAFGI